MVWYSHLFQKFPQFIVIHTVKGFGIVNKVEIDDFLELSNMVSGIWYALFDLMNPFFPSLSGKRIRHFKFIWNRK